MKITFRSLIPGINSLFSNKQSVLDREFTEQEIGAAFGHTLKKLREYKALTLTALSKAIDIPNPTINRYENGVNIPTITQAIKITDYFELSVELFVIMGLCGIYENMDIIPFYQKIMDTIQEARKQAVINKAKKRH